MAERRAKLREGIRIADDPEKPWPVNDLADGIRLTGATKNRLPDHFVGIGKQQMSLQELMDMCSNGPPDRYGWIAPALLRICGIGKYGFWSVVNGLTDMDLGNRCNEEWRKRLLGEAGESCDIISNITGRSRPFPFPRMLVLVPATCTVGILRQRIATKFMIISYKNIPVGKSGSGPGEFIFKQWRRGFD